jgi:hypothetical protein
MTTVYSSAAQYNEYIEILTSLHKHNSEPIDWNSVKKTPPPLEKAADNKKEKQARQKLLSYSPSLLDKLFNNKEKRIKDLTTALDQAIVTDKADYESYLSDYQLAVTDWQRRQKIAEGVLAKDTAAYALAIEYFKPFTEIKALGADVIAGYATSSVSLTLLVNAAEIIPAYHLMQISNGKTSKKEIPLSKFNELYKDYVCSCVLRLAREAYAYLPVDMVYVHVVALPDVTILSVAIPLNVLNKLRFESVDPSDSMRHFTHQMKFSKSGGFSAVERVNTSL